LQNWTNYFEGFFKRFECGLQQWFAVHGGRCATFEFSVHPAWKHNVRHGNRARHPKNKNPRTTATGNRFNHDQKPVQTKITRFFSVLLARGYVFAATPLFMGVPLMQISLNTPEINVMRAVE